MRQYSPDTLNVPSEATAPLDGGPVASDESCSADCNAPGRTDRLEACTPWVGDEYGSRSRIAVVGESHYGERHRWHERFTEEVVAYWTQIAPWRARRSGLFARVAKLLLDLPSRTRLSDEAYTAVYRRIAFWNFVPGLVGEKPRDRPSREQWILGARYFPITLSCLVPTALLVVGKATWDHLPAPLATDVVQLTLERTVARRWYEVAGRRIPAMYVNHTAWPGWRHAAWQPTVRALLETAS